MEFQQTSLPGVIVIVPRVFEDARGFFLESYQAARFAAAGIRAPFVQDNHSRSLRGTLRGLHAQHRRPQGKLVRAVRGEVFDVAVDARKGSPTFGRWLGERLSESNRKLIYVPPGFIHGFCVLSESAEVEYKCTDYYDPGGELTVIWNDPDIGVAWPIADPELSAKDRAGKRLREQMNLLMEYQAD
ncbi:MAG: dTDP-4-dehydrorhamnose 3,5-epimerase [Planctomycetes bacterium]|nr:dTDP-4-dehydrorhamnose 3,5-epimerase [Planctomycetota bacterium]